MNLIDAALLDQERRILDAHPLELLGASSSKRCEECGGPAANRSRGYCGRRRCQTVAERARRELIEQIKRGLRRGTSIQDIAAVCEVNERTVYRVKARMRRAA